MASMRGCSLTSAIGAFAHTHQACHFWAGLLRGLRPGRYGRSMRWPTLPAALLALAALTLPAPLGASAMQPGPSSLNPTAMPPLAHVAVIVMENRSSAGIMGSPAAP